VSETVRLSCAAEPFEGGGGDFQLRRDEGGFPRPCPRRGGGSGFGISSLDVDSGGQLFPLFLDLQCSTKKLCFFFLFGLIICVFPLAASGLELLMWSQGAGDFTLLLCAVLPPKL
jgi:hypothetical protein